MNLHVRTVDNMSNYLIEYMKIYLISLNQDLEIIESKSDLTGAHYVKKAEIGIIEHLLSVADDILMSSNFDDIHYSGGIH